MTATFSEMIRRAALCEHFAITGPGVVQVAEAFPAKCPWCEVASLKALLDRINMAACYASEENTEARAEALLLIGKLARGEEP